MSDLGAVLTAIITPFDERNRVNEESFVALIRHLAENGSDGFVVAGTTGEASTLSEEEQLGLIGLAVAERPEGKSIIAGTGTNDTRQAVHLTERATELGVDAVLSVTPYYNRPSRLGLTRHYQAVASATDKPTLLYNIPSRTGTNIPPDLLAELAQIEGDHGRQAGQPGRASADRRARRLRGRRCQLPAHARDGRRRRDQRGQPHRRQRAAPHGRGAGAPRRDRRLAARCLRDAVPHVEPDMREGRTEHARLRGGRTAPAARARNPR